MTKKCSECGSEDIPYDSYLGEFVCNSCGLVDDSYNQERIPEKQDFTKNQGNKKFFSSNYKKDKKKLGYSLNPKEKPYLNELFALENKLKEIFPDWKIIKEELGNFFYYNYQKDLVKTRDKRVFIWAILISLINNKKLLDDLPEYQLALSTLFEIDNTSFKKAEKMIDKLLTPESKIVNNYLNSLTKNIEWTTHVINFEEIDPKFKIIYKKDFYKLFSRESMLVPHEEVGGEEIKKGIRVREDEISKSSIDLAKTFILSNIDTYGKIGKKEGLLCACSYLICKQSNLRPFSIPRWASFFEISKSCLDKRLKELKETQVPHSDKLHPFELKIIKNSNNSK